MTALPRACFLQQPQACGDTRLASRAVPECTGPGHLHQGCGFPGRVGPGQLGGRASLPSVCVGARERARSQDAQLPGDCPAHPVGSAHGHFPESLHSRPAPSPSSPPGGSRGPRPARSAAFISALGLPGAVNSVLPAAHPSTRPATGRGPIRPEARGPHKPMALGARPGSREGRAAPGRGGCRGGGPRCPGRPAAAALWSAGPEPLRRAVPGGGRGAMCLADGPRESCVFLPRPPRTLARGGWHCPSDPPLRGL